MDWNKWIKSDPIELRDNVFHLIGKQWMLISAGKSDLLAVPKTLFLEINSLKINSTGVIF